MDNVQSDLGDIIVSVLSFCYSHEHQATFEPAAAQRNISVEQLVAAALAQKLSEEFVIRRKRTPGKSPTGQAPRHAR